MLHHNWDFSNLQTGSSSGLSFPGPGIAAAHLLFLVYHLVPPPHTHTAQNLQVIRNSAEMIVTLPYIRYLPTGTNFKLYCLMFSYKRSLQRWTRADSWRHCLALLFPLSLPALKFNFQINLPKNQVQSSHFSALNQIFTLYCLVM